MKTQQTEQRWDDIVFENRNKMYGAYALRQNYPEHVFRALLLCSGVVAGIILLPSQSIVKDLENTPKSGTTIDPVLPPIIKQENVRPKEIQHVKKTSSGFLPTRVTAADPHDIIPEDIVVESSNMADNPDGTFIETGIDNLPSVDIVEPVKTSPFVAFAEVMPAYEGGNAEMIKFIQKKLRYPAYASRMGITGTVYVSFVVAVNGLITHVEIIKGIDKGCDEEAMRVIGMMTKWKPGMQNKIPVAVRMVLPIKFIAGE